MIEQTDYVAMCCEQPMRNMGIWQAKATLVKWIEHEDGSMTKDVGDDHDVYAHRFHCQKCNRYIGLAWHQAPRIER